MDHDIRRKPLLLPMRLTAKLLLRRAVTLTRRDCSLFVRLEFPFFGNIEREYTGYEVAIETFSS